ncbi:MULTISPECIES: nucleoside diphosphate kinase regulator [Thauera]|uniref:nucleoside diphosphate kinase regulator n=1 Tax=Thauera TaxID=33057 RepID=UPI0008388A26|nr:MULTISPECIES: nucleoside diphosphate kinase regulator [Thauera]MCV2218303.1 nucleoside diphosphate kinase regulator [Thauera sp. Sel9]
MKPPIIVSSSDLERLEGLLTLPAFRSRSDLDGLREELERADVREPEEMPADVITMNSRARFLEEGTGREYELTLAYPKDANAEARRVSIFSPAGSALLGLATGQSIDWTTPDGKELHLKVLEVTWQPEANGQFDL